MDWLIDIGNSRVKFTAKSPLFEGFTIGDAVNTNLVAQMAKDPFQLTALLHDDLSPMLQSLQTTDRVFWTAGRSEKAVQASQQLLQFCKQQGIFVTQITVDSDLLSPNYADKQQFGVDRFLNLLAAKQMFGENFCVISAGTALTLDFYQQQHIGGLIFPGIASAMALLQEKTGLSVIQAPAAGQLLGNDTASSIGVGLFHGYRYLSEGAQQAVTAKTGCIFQPVFTGGDIVRIYGEAISDYPSLLFLGMQLLVQTRF